MYKCKFCPGKSFKTRAARATHAAFRHGKRRTGRTLALSTTPTPWFIDPEQVVHLRDVKKRSWRQIAETLHVSVGGVRIAYKKAKPAPVPPLHLDWGAVMNRPAPLTSLKMSGTVRGELTQIISGLKAEQALIADKISALEGALKYFQQ